MVNLVPRLSWNESELFTIMGLWSRFGRNLQNQTTLLLHLHAAYGSWLCSGYEPWITVIIPHDPVPCDFISELSFFIQPKCRQKKQTNSKCKHHGSKQRRVLGNWRCYTVCRNRTDAWYGIVTVYRIYFRLSSIGFALACLSAIGFGAAKAMSKRPSVEGWRLNICWVTVKSFVIWDGWLQR